MYKILILCLSLLYCLLHVSLGAAEVKIAMYQIDDKKMPGEYLGEVIFKDTDNGLLIMPDLKDLPPGSHGFHIHAHPDCKNLGLAAGGHFDPDKSNEHSGPYSETGHLGDVPELEVSASGTARQSTVAPKLTEADLDNHALMIHAGGDNYSDEPASLGGGGNRIACGIVENDDSAQG